MPLFWREGSARGKGEAGEGREGAELHVPRLNALAFAPLQIEGAVAAGEELLGVDTEQSGGGIDPFLGALDFRVPADRGFIECHNAMAVGVLGAVLFINKLRLVAEAHQNHVGGFRVRSFEFDFLAGLGAGNDGFALISDQAAGTHLAQPQDAAVGPQGRGVGIKKGVAFKDAPVEHAEPGPPQPELEAASGLQGNLDFDFNAIHTF